MQVNFIYSINLVALQDEEETDVETGNERRLQKKSVLRKSIRGVNVIQRGIGENKNDVGAAFFVMYNWCRDSNSRVMIIVVMIVVVTVQMRECLNRRNVSNQV